MNKQTTSFQQLQYREWNVTLVYAFLEIPAGDIPQLKAVLEQRQRVLDPQLWAIPEE